MYRYAKIFKNAGRKTVVHGPWKAAGCVRPGWVARSMLIPIRHSCLAPAKNQDLRYQQWRNYNLSGNDFYLSILWFSVDRNIIRCNEFLKKLLLYL